MPEVTTHRPKTGYQELEDVIAALRIAVEATESWEKLGKVAKAIIETAPETPDDNQGGLEVLLELQRSGRLAFELDADD